MRLIFIILFFLFGFDSYGWDDNPIRCELKKASEYLQVENQDSVDYHFQRALLLGDGLGDLKRGLIYYHIGFQYDRHFKHEKALFYLKEAQKLIADEDSTRLQMEIACQMGVTLYSLRNYPSALDQLKVGLELAFELDDTVQVSYCCNNIGLIFMETKDYTKAIDYFQKVIETGEGDDYLLSIAYNNLGIVFYHTEQFSKALVALELSRDYSLKIQGTPLLGNSYMNEGLCYIDLKDYRKAENSITQAYVFFKKIHNYEGQMMCKINLAKVYFKLGKVRRMQEIEKEVNTDLDAVLNPDLIGDFYTYMLDCYLELGDSSKALDYSLKMIEHGNSRLERFEDNTLNELKNDISYTSVVGELSHVQDEKKEIEEVNRKLKSRNVWIMILSLGLFLIGGVFILYMVRSVNKAKKINEQLQIKQTELAEKNREIVNSVVYANSMEKLLLQQMNPHFLFNALTTIEASIKVGDSQFANEYISLFSTLLRKTLDYSMLESISLLDEIDFLKSYIKLNATKQGDGFSCKFEYDYELVADFVNTPPMLVQPFVENALIHGLYHKTEGEKCLVINIQPKEEYILWIITDNGVGREKSRKISRSHQGISHGIKITRDRIKWMKKIYGNQFSIAYVDLEQGTQVILKTPIIGS